MESAEHYSYLWDGTDPGWVLHRVNRWTVSLSVVFGEKGPDAQDVKALREAVAYFSDKSAAECMTSLRGFQIVELGEYEQEEAQNIAQACKNKGLYVNESLVDRSGYLPFNVNRKHALLIEDELISNQVCEMALKHGVPVRYIEA